MHPGNRKYHLNCSQNRKIPDKVYIGWSARFPVTPNEPKWPRSFCSETPCMKPKCIGKTKDSRQETNNLEHTLLRGNETWTSILIVSQSKAKQNEMYCPSLELQRTVRPITCVKSAYHLENIVLLLSQNESHFLTHFGQLN